MRAVVMSEPSDGPETTAVREVAAPRPGPGQVSIGVEYAGINFIDVMARRGDPGYASQWPYVPGLEVAGIVRSVGPDVDLVAGRRVAAFTAGGGLAEVALADAALVVPVPDGVPLPVAAAAPLVLSTAWLLLDEVARLRAGESVLMHSASGGVGSAIAQLVPLLGGGLRIGTVSRPDKVDGARRAGWDVALVRDDGLVAAVEGGVDVVLDPAGTGLLEVDLELVRPGGRIVLFGNAGGGQPAPLPPAGRLIGGNVTLAGFSMSRLTETAPARVAAALRHVLGLLAEGRLDLPVTEIGQLDEVADVHQRLAEGRGAGKYVVRVRS